MISKKIAMLGMWGVGKTSLVQRFVNSLFDETYHSTLGVKVDKKVVAADAGEVNLMLWDIAGAEDHFDVPMHFVKGAAGYLLVIDGTRAASLDKAVDLVGAVKDGVGDIPFVALVNKADLDWEITQADIDAALGPFGCPVFRSSARTGEHVEDAFLTIANAVT